MIDGLPRSELVAVLPWPEAVVTAIPGGDAGVRFLLAATADVPSRGEGRTKEHREGYCVLEALRWLILHRPSLFPARLTRGESPDFLLTPDTGITPVAMEQTDAGEQSYHEGLAQTEGLDEPLLLPSGIDGWTGDQPEQAFEAALADAIRRKAKPSVWRNAPPEALKCVILYDQTETGIFVLDEAVQPLLEGAFAAKRIESSQANAIILVRGDTRVFCVGLKP